MQRLKANEPGRGCITTNQAVANGLQERKAPTPPKVLVRAPNHYPSQLREQLIKNGDLKPADPS